MREQMIKLADKLLKKLEALVNSTDAAALERFRQELELARELNRMLLGDGCTPPLIGKPEGK